MMLVSLYNEPLWAFDRDAATLIHQAAADGGGRDNADLVLPGCRSAARVADG